MLESWSHGWGKRKTWMTFKALSNPKSCRIHKCCLNLVLWDRKEYWIFWKTNTEEITHWRPATDSALLQERSSFLPSPQDTFVELPAIRTEELGSLEEGVGSEDGGDDLAGGVDGAFAVWAGLRVAAPRVGAQTWEDADTDGSGGAVNGRTAQGCASKRPAGQDRASWFLSSGSGSDFSLFTLLPLSELLCFTAPANSFAWENFFLLTTGFHGK